MADQTGDPPPALASADVAQLCSATRTMNLWFYSSPERDLIFEINGFNKPCPGP